MLINYSKNEVAREMTNLPTNDVNKTKVTRPRARPPEVNKGTWRV